jgi:hypothetical protein
MAMALYSIAPVLLAVHAGAATSHLGPRRMLAAGSGVLLCGAALQACPPYVLLFPGALLSGIGFTVLQISLQMHIGESCRPDARVRHFGYFSMVQSAATSLAAMLVGYLSGTRGFHTPLWLTAGVAAALLALVVLSRRLFRSSPATAAAQREGSRQGSFIRLVRQRDVRTVLVAGALLAMAWDLHAFIVPFVSHSVKLSPQQIGIVLGLFSGATFVIRVCLPGLIRLVSSVGVIRAALIVVGLCFAAYPWRTKLRDDERARRLPRARARHCAAEPARAGARRRGRAGRGTRDRPAHDPAQFRLIALAVVFRRARAACRRLHTSRRRHDLSAGRRAIFSDAGEALTWGVPIADFTATKDGGQGTRSRGNEARAAPRNCPPCCLPRRSRCDEALGGYRPPSDHSLQLGISCLPPTATLAHFVRTASGFRDDG